MKDARTQWVFLIFLFLFALALRVGYSLYLQNNYFFYSNPGEDVAYYKNWAKAIVFGAESHAPFAGMPLFPYYLAVLFKLTFGNWAAVGFFNLVLGALNCVLVFLLAQKLFSFRVAVIAGLLTATNFILIYYDWLMMPITLLIMLTLVILLALTDHTRLTPRQWLIVGVLLGIATLGDGKFLIFSALLIAYLGWTYRKIMPAILPIILGLSIILGGVTLRNKIAGGEWVFITSQSGLSLFVGNNPQATGAYEHPEFLRPSHEGQDLDQKLFVEQALGRKANQGEVNDFFRQKAISFITTQPITYLQLLGKKIDLFISDHEQSQAIDLILQSNLKRCLDWNSYRLIFPLALLGIFLCFRQRLVPAPATLLLAAQIIFSLIYFVTTRHRASILPVLIIFEAYALSWLLHKINSRQYKVLYISILAIMIFVLLTPPRSMDPKTFAFLNHSKTGSVYEAKKDYLNAAQEYNKALKLQPYDANNLYNLATAYVNLKEYPKAETLYLKALEITDFNVDVLFNLGYVYEQTGETEKALAAYQKVLSHAPDSLDAHFRIAKLYQAQGQCDLAKPHYQEIIRLNPILKTEIEKVLKTCS